MGHLTKIRIIHNLYDPLQRVVCLVRVEKVVLRQGDGLLLASGLLLRFPREVDIEVHLERRNRGELHKLLRDVLNETEVLVRPICNDDYETEMDGAPEGLGPFRLGGGTEIPVFLMGHFDLEVPGLPVLLRGQVRRRGSNPGLIALDILHAHLSLAAMPDFILSHLSFRSFRLVSFRRELDIVYSFWEKCC